MKTEFPEFPTTTTPLSGVTADISTRAKLVLDEVMSTRPSPKPKVEAKFLVQVPGWQSLGQPVESSPVSHTALPHTAMGCFR